jgi:probable phosphoglycerate mutase
VIPELWLVRHAETEWSASARHTSVTDIPLTDHGESVSRTLAPRLAGHPFAAVWCSPRTRARETAALAGFDDPEIIDDLAEWNYGELEGLTSEQIRARGPEFAQWTIWRGPVPGGETIEQVAARMARVVARADAAKGSVLCFGHGHALRVLTAVALGLDPHAGAHFALDPATLNVIGTEHEVRALRLWNS